MPAAIVAFTAAFEKCSAVAPTAQEAEFFVAEAFRTGNGTSTDLSKALEHYQRAGRLGHAEALFQAGCLFEHGGDGLEKNPKEAFKHYKAAADREHPDSLAILGSYYLNNK